MNSANNEQPTAIMDNIDNNFSVELNITNNGIDVKYKLHDCNTDIKPETEYFDIHAALTKINENLSSVNEITTHVNKYNENIASVSETKYLEENSNVHDQYALRCLNEKISHFNQDNKCNTSASSETELLEIITPVYKRVDSDSEDNYVHNEFCQKQLDSLLSSSIEDHEIQTCAYLSEEEITQEIERLKLVVFESQIQNEWMKGEKDIHEMTKFINQCLGECVLETDSDSFDDEDDGLCDTKSNTSNPDLQYEEGDIIIKQLPLKKQCKRLDCMRKDCQTGKQLYEIIHSCSEEDMGLRHEILTAIVKHSRQCNECCNVPHCNFFKENELEDSTISDMILSFDEEFNGSQIQLKVSNTDEFISLDEGYESMPEQGVHYEIYSRINESVFFGTCYRISQENSSLRHLIIKKAICDESMDDVVPCIKEIQSLQSPESLVRFFWMIKCCSSKLGYLTSGFEACTNLQQLILTHHPCGIPRNILVPNVHHLNSALQFLKDNDILYLNWQADHVLLCDGVLKLCNFTTALVGSTLENKEEEYFQDIYDKLPPFVVPPELHDDTLYFPASDYWGFGCILFEMVTGKCVHWDKHFHTIEKQRELIKDAPRPPVTELGSNQNDVKHILEKCFSIDYKGRTLNSSELLLL